MGSRDHQIEVLADIGLQRFPGIQQRVQILARFDGPDEKNIGFGAGARPGVEILFGDAGMDGADSLRLDPQQANRILARVLGNRDQSMGAFQDAFREGPVGAQRSIAV